MGEGYDSPVMVGLVAPGLRAGEPIFPHQSSFAEKQYQLTRTYEI